MSATKKKRTRKLPSSVSKDYTVFPVEAHSECWCKVLCLSNNREYIVNSNTLETLEGLPIAESDLVVNKKVIWFTQKEKKPFKVKLLEISDDKSELELYRRGQREQSVDESKDHSGHTPCQLPKSKKRKIVLDSSSEDDKEENTELAATVVPSKCKPMKKKALFQNDLFVEKEVTVPSYQDNSLEHNISPPKQNFCSPVLTADGTFRNNTFRSSTIQFTSKERDMLVTLKENQCDLIAKVDRVYRLVKHLVDSKHSTNSITHSTKEEGKTVDEDDRFVSENGVNLLAINGKEPAKYLLSLMDVLFTHEEMATSCFYRTSRSTKPSLPLDKIKLIEECIDKRFGNGVYKQSMDTFRSKGNQKCLDQNRKLKSTEYKPITKEE